MTFSKNLKKKETEIAMKRSILSAESKWSENTSEKPGCNKTFYSRHGSLQADICTKIHGTVHQKPIL